VAVPPRPGRGRLFAFLGVGLFMLGLAFLVARPSVPDPATNPYAGVRGASRTKAAGLRIYYRRGETESAVEPGAALRAGDVLRFVFRGERPRHLEVRLKDGDGPAGTVFPMGAGETSPVQPSASLGVTPTVAPGKGKVIVTALFSDAPRAVGAPPDGDTEVVTMAIPKE
jgi:hypothetical protein